MKKPPDEPKEEMLKGLRWKWWILIRTDPPSSRRATWTIPGRLYRFHFKHLARGIWIRWKKEPL